MSKNAALRKDFLKNIEDLPKLSEHELSERLNVTMVAVEKDKQYTIAEKLRIYERLSAVANCDPPERKKKAVRLSKAL